MTFKNTTVQNRSKRERLNSSHTIPSHYIEGSSVPKFLLQLLELDATKEEILFSLGVQLLKNKSNPAIRRFLKEHKLKIIIQPVVLAHFFSDQMPLPRKSMESMLIQLQS